MTLLYRDRPKIRLGVDEMHGLLNVLDSAIAEHADDGELSTLYYVGAHGAIEILYEHEHIEYPDEFLQLLDMKVKAYDKDWSKQDA